MPYHHNKKLTPYAKNLRKEMTREERKLWYEFLRSYPIRFLRQKVIDEYIVDFYCARAKLVIEIDGSQHYEAGHMEYDKKRTEHLKKLGLRVIRIPNNEISGNFDDICSYIDTVIRKNLALE